MKKTLIVLGIIIAVIVILSVIISRRSTLQIAPGGTTGTQPAATLPTDNAGRPPGGRSTATKFIDSTIRVEDQQNASQIKNSFENYVKQDIKDFPDYIADGISQDYPLSDKEGKLVDLDLFLKSVDAKINPKLRAFIGSNYYGFFYCINQNKQKEYGAVFDTGKNDPSKTDSQHKEAVDDMRLWEPYILKDFHNVLFPGINLDEKYLNQQLSFRDGKFRYAEIDFPTGKKSISYTVKEAPSRRIYISISQECVEKALEYLFDL